MRAPGRALALAFLAILVLPAVVLAHPLGNFTINHYAGLRIEPDRVTLDLVIDQAEIPAFQARQALDANEDGEVSDAELEAGRVPSCAALTDDLHLAVEGSPMEPTLTAAGVELRPGVGGLSTLRLVCVFEAGLTAPVASGTHVEFADTSYAGRLGWREIVVEGSGVAVTPVEGELRESSISDRLQAYPADRLDNALADERVVVAVSPGGAELPPVAVPDATPVDAAPAEPASVEDTRPVAAVPGGVGGEIPALFQTPDLTPFVLLLSLATAAALGAAHALTPGHGKSLMAAYLVGTRGTPVHAIGLGLSVSASHTLGILALAAVIVGAQGLLSPDLVVRTAPLLAAAGIVAIGGWMLISELRRRHAARNAGHDHEHSHDHDDHGHDHDHNEPHSHGGVPHSHLPDEGGHRHVAEPVRARAGRRIDPLDERAADPARGDRQWAGRVRRRARGRLRARHGGRDDRRRARADPRPRPHRRPGHGLALRPASGVAAARGGMPRPRDRPLPDGAGGGGPTTLLAKRNIPARHTFQRAWNRALRPSCPLRSAWRCSWAPARRPRRPPRQPFAADQHRANAVAGPVVRGARCRGHPGCGLPRPAGGRVVGPSSLRRPGRP